MSGKNFSKDIVADIEGCFILNHPCYEDHRGFFMEVQRASWTPQFVQQNLSFSFDNVLRGMHFQSRDPQGKLVTCVFGTILDVIFDLRPESKTFGKGYARELSWNSGESLYAPPGVAHGFLVLSRHAVVNYNCTSYHDPDSDAGVRWDSDEIRPFFPPDIDPVLSIKDSNLPTVSEYLSARRFD